MSNLWQRVKTVLVGESNEPPLPISKTKAEPSKPLAAEVATIQAAFDQLRFLLSQAPLMDFPTDEGWRLVQSTVPYAYVHPKTLLKVKGVMFLQVYHPGTRIVKGYQVSGTHSGTLFVPTSFMPEGRVIFSPNAMPGLERILGRNE